MANGVVENFVDVPIVITADTLTDDAIDALQARWPGWMPNDGDPEVVVFEIAGQRWADIAEQASQMPSAALRAFGTKLLDVPYGVGNPAWTTVTFTVIDDQGYTIPDGSEVEIDGYAFAVRGDTTIAQGTTSLSIPVYATENTVLANDLPGMLVLPILMPTYVVTMTVDTPTHGGVDPEDDSTYQVRIVQNMRLRSKTLVNASDFVIAALSQDGVGRAAVIGNTARQVKVGIADTEGQPVSAVTKTALTTMYESQRMVNYQVTLEDPTYTTVNITWSVFALPGYVVDDLLTRVNARLTQVLSPAVYGNANARPVYATDPNMPTQAEDMWNNAPVLYKNWVIGQIAQVMGVDRVIDATIGGAAADGSLTMTGDFPLPQVGTLTGSVALPAS